VDWIKPTGARKVHSLMDKVYQRKNLAMAWEMVQANRGSGGVDGQSLEGFAAQLDQQLDRWLRERKGDVYPPQPVRQVQIRKAGKPGEFRTLGIPTIYDRVCQQALLNRLEPIFEPVFDDANFGYRRGRSTRDALRKVWKEITGGREWIVDADLKDFFGSVEHAKLLTNARGPESSRWPGAASDRGDAQGGKLWQRAAVSNRARDSARRGSFTLA
jgi:RNA-directed DNA polymerase